MERKYSPEELIKRYQAGTCNEEEKALVESWHIHDLSQSDFMPSFQSIERANAKTRQAIMAHTREYTVVLKIWPRLAVAASLLICLGIAAYIFSTKSTISVVKTTQLPDIAPGGNKAILTLSNGRQINLYGAKNGELALEGQTSIHKTADGNVTYRPATGQASAIDIVEYNTMSAPIGGQYQLILADGTKAWLNAASSIKYPTAFPGKERKVEVTGEVYFEVAHNAAKPFIVVANEQVVEVLGTHFNINAYPDEANVKTTLLEGSVKIVAGKNSVVIKPGQQSTTRSGRITVGPADLDEAVAWKNGYFQFKDEKIASIMRKLSRWYNIDVQYEGKVSEEGFNGAISRFKNISQVLKMLEKTKVVHFKIEGRRVTITQ
ncbi:FecR family protein [Chitinophaga costaii]|uniref:FecR family protein n=1 Tax=Chitinophaga costaii TaxID=1335309 RepID=A0A1C4CVJ5_9BACT|nr:FecR family protein [Chitinophaga costaii]PUZ26929.1 FecR family protein [Chitinophaga costaii]SCC23050.1 FecR family protein [Chitinophaga costaii]